VNLSPATIARCFEQLACTLVQAVCLYSGVQHVIATPRSLSPQLLSLLWSNSILPAVILLSTFSASYFVHMPTVVAADYCGWPRVSWTLRLHSAVRQEVRVMPEYATAVEPLTTISTSQRDCLLLSCCYIICMYCTPPWKNSALSCQKGEFKIKSNPSIGWTTTSIGCYYQSYKCQPSGVNTAHGPSKAKNLRGAH